jgi:hypothetical protein
MARVEVYTGPERRRRWSEEEKRAIVAASLAPGAVVSEVARRVDVGAGQIYRWRKEFGAVADGFAPVLITAPEVIRSGLGAPGCRHAEDLRRRWRLVAHAGDAMGTQHHAHLLQYVAVIIDARLVDPDRGGDPGRLELVECRDTRTQPEIRRAIVTDMGPGFCQPLDVSLIEPYAVAERHLRSEEAEAVDLLHRAAATPPPPPRRWAYSFWYAVSSRCICNGTLYLREQLASRVSASSEHQCRLAGASCTLPGGCRGTGRKAPRTALCRRLATTETARTIASSDPAVPTASWR